MNRKAFFRILRLAVAAGLMFFLLRRIGLEQLCTVLETRQPFYFLLLVALVCLDAVLRASNWGALLGTRGHNLRLREMIFNYMAGAFFGTFIPSSLGTDVTRAVLVSRRNGVGAGDSALAMIVLNLMGLLALSLIGIVSALILLGIHNGYKLPLLIVAMCGSFLALFPLLMSGHIPFSGKLGQYRRLQAVLGKLMEMSAALAAFKGHRLVMKRVLLVSILNQAIAISMVFIAACALGVDVSLLFCIAVVPVIAISRLVPISIAGLGGEQGIFVLLFAQAGVAEAEAFMISLTVTFANLGLALLGGLVYNLNSLWKLVAGSKGGVKTPPTRGSI